MKGLLLKDFYSLRQQLIYYLIFTAASVVLTFTWQNVSVLMGISVFLTISIPTSAMAYDERDRWTKYARACGLKPREIVAEKYLLMLLSAATVFVPLTVYEIFAAEKEWLTVAVFMSLALITAAALLPLMFKYGVEKGRVALMVAFVAILAVSIGVIALAENNPSADLTTLLCVAVPLAAVAAVVASVIISVKIAENKDV